MTLRFSNDCGTTELTVVTEMAVVTNELLELLLYVPSKCTVVAQHNPIFIFKHFEGDRYLLKYFLPLALFALNSSFKADSCKLIS